MNDEHLPTHSQLFTVRLWAEDLGDGRVELRGKAQHALTGEACYFRDWASLIAFLGGRLPQSPQGDAAAGEESGP